MKAFIFLGVFGLGASELLVILVVVLMMVLVPYILYLVTLSNTIKACAQHNRKISPGEVWLVLIPFFGIVWNFIMVARIADTLAAEYRQRNIPLQEERPAYNVGLTFCILACCGWIPFIGGLCSLGTIICWIIYWVRISSYKRTLEQNQFQFGNHNPNPYAFPNQFPGQPNYPNQPHNPNQ